MSISCHTATCFRSGDIWSAGEQENISEEVFLSEHGKWAWILQQNIKDTQQQDSGVEMQIFKDYSNLDSVPSNLQEHHIDDISDKDETKSNNSTSAAIPVPTRSLSRQSSRNCATPSSENAYSVKETTSAIRGNENIDDITQNGKETLEVDPCFSPLVTSRKDSVDMTDVESTTADSFKVGQQVSSHDTQQTIPIYQQNTSTPGLCPATSFSYSSGRPCSAFRKSKMTFISPISSGYGTLSSSTSCPSIMTPVDFPRLQEKRHSFPKVPGFRTEDPPKSLQSVDNDGSSYLERFQERAFEPLCRSDPQRWHQLENDKENCKNCCNRLKVMSKSDTDQCCKRCWDFRDASLDRSPVETCDASTSPHLPLEKIWKCEALSPEQCDIHPVIADKPDGLDKRKVLRPSDYQYDAFLDYNIQDEAWAEELVAILEGPKYKFCIYMYERDRVLGRPIISDIATQIQNSFKYICILSPHFLSTPVMFNLDMAQHERVTKRPFSNFVILLKIAPCEVPLSLASLEWEDCLKCKNGPNRYVLEKVVRAIRDVT